MPWRSRKQKGTRRENRSMPEPSGLDVPTVASGWWSFLAFGLGLSKWMNSSRRSRRERSFAMARRKDRVIDYIWRDAAWRINRSSL